MGDAVDKANDWRDLEAALRVGVARIKATQQEVEAIGECLFCGEHVSGARRWCDAEHRDLWERQRANQN